MNSPTDEKIMVIVDGYNYLHSTMKMNKISKIELEQLRNKLIEDLNQLAIHKGSSITVVFDSSNKGNVFLKNKVKNKVTVLFTKKGQSADNLAETLVYKNKGKRIFVVTSDYTHQRVTFGGGAFRMTTRQLRSQLKQLKREIRSRDIFSNKLNVPISKRIDKKIERKLDKIRKGKV